MLKLMAIAAVLIALIAPAQAWTPEDCRPGLGAPASETKSLVRYCSALQRKLIADDPGSYILGRIEKAEPVQDDLNSKFYYWIVSFDADAAGSSYFDSRSESWKKSFSDLSNKFGLCSQDRHPKKLGVECEPRDLLDYQGQ